MGWLNRTIAAVAPTYAAQRSEARLRYEVAEAKRSSVQSVRQQYDGATHSRRTQGYRRNGRDANYELQGAAQVLAQTARDMVRNTIDFAKMRGKP